MAFWGPALSRHVLWDGPERGESGGKETSSVTLQKRHVWGQRGGVQWGQEAGLRVGRDIYIAEKADSDSLKSFKRLRCHHSKPVSQGLLLGRLTIFLPET